MIPAPLKQLSRLSLEDFFARFWQKKAVYLPNVFPEFRSPLTPDELAGLALEQDIESRLITHSDSAPWQLRNGPFSEADLASLSEKNWTLLVQAVDHWVPEVASLLDAFRFIPNWRLDDIMVSYAPTGGSVGPHFDYYDVFLLQGAGHRRWHIGAECDANTPRLEGTPLHILKDFIPTETYDLAPGDILYVPPGVAHWGVSLDDECMTYSIGFRAPSHAEILTGLSQSIAAEAGADKRYRDQLVSATTNPGCIDRQTLSEIKNIVAQYLTEQHIANWFGRAMSEAKYPDTLPEGIALDAQEFAELLAADATVEQAPGARFCFTEISATEATLFACGKAYACTVNLARLLCQKRTFTLAEVADRDASDSNCDFIQTLLADGSLVIYDPEED
ncbi:MAG TPA: cupin domain-containing protein [Cellvibrionaceae bacterium]